VVVPLFPSASASLWWVVAGLGLLNVFYHSLAAIGQPGLRRAIVHLAGAMCGFVLVGVATLTPAGMNAAAFTLLAASVVTALLLLLADRPPDPGAANATSPAGSAWAATFAVGLLALGVVPGLLGQAGVLFGACKAASRGSALIRSQAATSGLLFTVAGGICLGICLFGVALAQTMRLATREEAPAGSAPRAGWMARCSAGHAALAAFAVLFGVLAGPLCFAFTRRAIGAMMGMPQ
jgi:formate hydrogenlyase subunit 3/multisubunit Na+/H+ antiporter MnhD subunit